LRAAIILRLAIMVCFPIYVRYKPQRLVSVSGLCTNRFRYGPMVTSLAVRPNRSLVVCLTLRSDKPLVEPGGVEPPS
jgi:hypothetical protein